MSRTYKAAPSRDEVHDMMARKPKKAKAKKVKKSPRRSEAGDGLLGRAMDALKNRRKRIDDAVEGK